MIEIGAMLQELLRPQPLRQVLKGGDMKLLYRALSVLAMGTTAILVFILVVCLLNATWNESSIIQSGRQIEILVIRDADTGIPKVLNIREGNDTLVVSIPKKHRVSFVDTTKTVSLPPDWRKWSTVTLKNVTIQTHGPVDVIYDGKETISRATMIVARLE